MDGVGGGFVGTEFQLRFDVQGSDDIQPSIGERGLVAGNWDRDFLRYLYCIGFCDSPLPEYDLH